MTASGVDPSLASDSPILWQVQRGAHPALVAWSLVLALALVAASVLIVSATALQPSIWPGLICGLALAWMIPAAMLQGATCRVHADGQLVYGFGPRPNAVVPLAAIEGWTMVQAGMLRGVGAQVDPAAVRFLHRRGLSYPRLLDQQRRHGAALVLEFLRPEDLTELRRLQNDLSPSNP